MEQDSQTKRRSGKKYSVQRHVRDKLILPTQRSAVKFNISMMKGVVWNGVMQEGTAACVGEGSSMAGRE